MNRTTIIMGIVLLLLGMYLTAPSIQIPVQIDIDPIEKLIVDTQLDYEKENPVIKLKQNCDASILKQDTIKRIVIHHTVSDGEGEAIYKAISQSHMKIWDESYKLYDMDQIMSKQEYMSGVAGSDGYFMMYHRLIDKSGRIYGDRGFDQVGRAARMNCNNIGTIHIALVGNFDSEEVTPQQYTTLEDIIKSLKIRYGSNIEIIGQGQMSGEITTSPGKLFNRNTINPLPMIAEIIEPTVSRTRGVKGGEIPSDSSYNIAFSISRYYSPLINQRSYFQGKTYQQDKITNCGTGDCLVTASGKTVSMADKNNIVACPSKYPFGTKIGLWIAGKQHIVTCEDKGGSIVNNRLDIYCGVGQYALDNFDTCISGTPIYGKIL